MLRIHNWSGDYYRFSPQAYKDVIFDGMKVVEVYSIMVPPRISGIGYNVKLQALEYMRRYGGCIRNDQAIELRFRFSRTSLCKRDKL